MFLVKYKKRDRTYRGLHIIEIREGKRSHATTSVSGSLVVTTTDCTGHRSHRRGPCRLILYFDPCKTFKGSVNWKISTRVTCDTVYYVSQFYYFYLKRKQEKRQTFCISLFNTQDFRLYKLSG